VAAGVVYLTDMEGDTHLFKVARTAEKLGVNSLGERVVATPAAVGGKLYIRGVASLYCIGR
jgi:hypothetical protein